MASFTIGNSLQKLNVTSSYLLSLTDSSITSENCVLPSFVLITNEVVLDLYYFMCSHSDCTYKTLTLWLSCFYGGTYPIHDSSVKSITQSVKRLLAKLDKLKKLPNSPGKNSKIYNFKNEPFCLPRMSQSYAKCSSDSQSEDNQSFCQKIDSSHNEEVDSSNEVENLKTINDELSCELAQLKINESTTDPSLKYLREKMYSLHRNTNKKLVRRDKAILEQSERIDKQKEELDKLQIKFTQMQTNVQQLKKDKEQLRHKAAYWKTKTENIKSSSEDQEIESLSGKQQEIDTLKQNIHYVEDCNIDLQEKLTELSEAYNNEIEIKTFCKGKFSDNVRSCCYDLLSLNVGIKNIEPVIRSVIKHLSGRSIGRLPSHTVLCRMMLEGLALSKIQLGEKLSQEDLNHLTIQTDGTTKYGDHYATFDVATGVESYTLGIRLVFSGSAQNSLEALKEILDDLDVVQTQIGQANVSSRILLKLKNTMSDRHAAEKLFNELITDYRAEILPEIMSNWYELSESEREQYTRMNNFFCGLHFLVGLADTAESTLRLWEITHELPDGGNSSGTQRLIRTSCKAFHCRGSQQAGCSSHFRAFLRNYNINKIPLAAFHGNRFNILFYDAAGVYFLRDHMLNYLSTSHGSLNLLLQAVLADLKVQHYIAGCKALGIVDKLITGPLWRHLQLTTTSILTMSDVYSNMCAKFEEWGQDAQAILDGVTHFLPNQETKDDVWEVLFKESKNDDLVLELLQLLFKSFTTTTQRLLMDHLPGGMFHNVTDHMLIEEISSVPTTNVSPERDFAMLDRLMSEKPNANHIALESLILFSHNQTSSWLQSKSSQEKATLFQAARTLSPLQKTKFLKRREEIKVKREMAVKKKQEEFIKKQQKEVLLKEALTKKLQKVGLWSSRKDIEEGLGKFKSAKQKCDALKLQINFRKKVLGQSHVDKKVFFFSHKGRQYTYIELFDNLLKLLPTEQPPHQFTFDQLVSSPVLLVNKRIEHLFESDEGLQWYTGTVLEYYEETQEYKVIYDFEDAVYLFPLLDDLENNELRVFEV